MPPTTNDVFKLEIVYTAAGEFMECVLHFYSGLASSPTPQPDALALITGFQSLFESALLNCWSSDVALIGYRAVRVNNGGGSTAVVPSPAGTIGTAGVFAGVVSTTRQAALIETDYYDTAAVKPRYRQGRIYLGGVPNGYWGDNMWSGPAVTAYTAFASLLAGIMATTPTFQYGIWSKKNSICWIGGDAELSNKMGHIVKRTRPRL